MHSWPVSASSYGTPVARTFPDTWWELNQYLLNIVLMNIVPSAGGLEEGC